MSDNIEWVQTSSAINEISATDGLQKVGPYVSVNPDGSTIGISSDQVAVLQDGITTRELAPSAVEQENIRSGACGTDAIEDLSVTNGKLSGGIQGSKLSDFTLTSNLYAPQSVDGAAMKLRSVSTQIIGLGAVQSENIAAGSVQSDQIDTAAVDGSIHVSPRKQHTSRTDE